jgi:hypothetical protein
MSERYIDPRFDPVIRCHLRLPPPEPERYLPLLDLVEVNGELLKPEEYRRKYPDFSRRGSEEPKE